MQGKGENEIDEKLDELYIRGLDTLELLMHELRLDKEWKESIKQQYDQHRGLDNTIKLLTRCKKMFQAKTEINRILVMIVERERLVEYAHIFSRLSGTDKAKKNLAAIKRLEVKITS